MTIENNMLTRLLLMVTTTINNIADAIKNLIKCPNDTIAHTHDTHTHMTHGTDTQAIYFE